MKECPESRRPLTLLLFTVVAIITALVIALLLSLSLPAGWIRVVGMASSSVLAVLFILLGAMKFLKQHKLLKAMCLLCETPIVYATRRFTYSCRTSEGKVLCYSSASNRVYNVDIEEVLGEEDASPWEALDFYCVKPVKGTYEKAEGKITFTGEYLFYDSIRRKLVRARGRVESLAERWLLDEARKK